MINRAVIIGRLTREIELRKTQTGLSVASFTIAANRPKKKDEEQKAILQGWESVADRERKIKELDELIARL